MALRGALLFLLIQHVLSITNKPNETAPIDNNDKCMDKLENALSSMSKKRTGGQSLDLTGYALHQPLRSAPYDMYLTDMRIRAPGKWAKIEKCRYDPGLGTLQTRLIFRDLAVTGKVKLYKDELLAAPPAERCNMTLRMRRAGLGFTVYPNRGRSGALGVNTAATFVEPQFVSVHSYGCKGIEDDPARSGPEAREDKMDMTVEMEEVFMRGVRSLLTRYLEHQLEPSLRDTLMLNLGYSISYGR